MFSAIALIAVLAIVVELFSFLVLHIAAERDRARSNPELTKAAYRHEPWASTYWREHRHLLSQSYEPYPYGLWRLRPFRGETITVDTNGIRRTEYSQCESDKPVVYVFGGSTVWGQGSPDWDTIPSNLAKRFAAAGQPRCVVNMGNDAWRSDEGVNKLIQELKRPGARRPSFVVFMDSCNDVFTPFLYTGQVDSPWNFNKEWLDALAVRHMGSFRYLGMTNTATLAERVKRRVTGRSNMLRPLPPDPERVAREVADNYLKNVQIVDALSRNFDFRYAFFWLPLDVTQDPLFRVPLETTLPLIRKAAGHQIHDLSRIFDNRSDELFLDACHLLPEANRILADRVFETVSRDPAQPTGARTGG